MELRPQCKECPWRDMEWMKKEAPETVEHARDNPDGFVCHTRMGPCDGPSHALKKEKVAV